MSLGALQLPTGQVLKADDFYRLRDGRTVGQPADNIFVRIAIVVPPDVAAGPGAELALLWTSSMIRRMGRAFANLFIVTSREFANSPSQLLNSMEKSIADGVTEELLAADPFAEVEWREFGDASAWADASASVWLGRLPVHPGSGEGDFCQRARMGGRNPRRAGHGTLAERHGWRLRRGALHPCDGWRAGCREGVSTFCWSGTRAGG